MAAWDSLAKFIGIGGKSAAPKKNPDVVVQRVWNPTPQKSLRAVEAELDRAAAQKASHTTTGSSLRAAGVEEPGWKPKTSKPKVSSNAVARRVGVAGPATPAAPPVDPLEVLRGEYDKYLTGVYGGLTTSLEDIRNQYQTRSGEIADRLKNVYGEAEAVAGQTQQRAQTGMEEFAKRMGLESTTQGQASQDWMQTNERLKSLNAVNRASSLSTNDLIRSNYYDFLTDKVAGAKGLEAQSRAGLNDVFAQAQIAKQQAAAAAAYAARSSRRGGGGGSGSPTGSQSTAVKNEEMWNQFMNNPIIQAGMIADDPIAASILRAGTAKYTPSTTKGMKGVFQKASTQLKNAYATPSLKSKQDALMYYISTGKAGGPVTSSTSKIK